LPCPAGEWPADVLLAALVHHVQRDHLPHLEVEHYQVLSALTASGSGSSDTSITAMFDALHSYLFVGLCDPECSLPAIRVTSPRLLCLGSMFVACNSCEWPTTGPDPAGGGSSRWSAVCITLPTRLLGVVASIPRRHARPPVPSQRRHVLVRCYFSVASSANCGVLCVVPVQDGQC
jgi:hypothetical protein